MAMSSKNQLLHSNQQQHQEQRQQSQFRTEMTEGLNESRVDQSVTPVEEDNYPFEREHLCYPPEYYQSPHINVSENNYNTNNIVPPNYMGTAPSASQSTQLYPHYAYFHHYVQDQLQQQHQHQEQQEQQLSWCPYYLPKPNCLIPASNIGCHYTNVYPQQQQPTQNHLYNHCHRIVHEDPRNSIIFEHENNRSPLTVQREVIYHYYTLDEDERLNHQPIDRNQYERNCGLIMETDEDHNNKYLYKIEQPSMYVEYPSGFSLTSINPSSSVNPSSSTPDLELGLSTSSLFSSPSFFPPASSSATLYQVDSKLFPSTVQNSSSNHDRCHNQDKEYHNNSSVEIEEIVEDKPLPSTSSKYTLASPSKKDAITTCETSTDPPLIKLKVDNFPCCSRNYSSKKVPKKLRKNRKCITNFLYSSVNCKRQEIVSNYSKKREEVYNNRDYEVRPSAYMAKEGYLVEEPVDDELDVNTRNKEESIV